MPIFPKPPFRPRAGAGWRLRRPILTLSAVVLGAGLVAWAPRLPQDTQPTDPPDPPAAAPDAGTQDAAEPGHDRRSVTVRRGDTLLEMLLAAGVPRVRAHRAVASLGAVYDPRDLRAGQKVTLVTRPGGDGEAGPRFHGLRLDAAVDREVSVIDDGNGGFAASETLRPLTGERAHAAGRIDSSLFVSAEAAGVPVPLVVAMIRLFSYDVDFQRQVRPGDGFELFYQRFRFADGRIARHGEILHAALTLSGKRLALYRFTPENGKADYYDATGESVRKALMRTPIDGARLSSRFGKRRHPIKGYTRMHRGVDFAAPRGTPIYAAGDGVVSRIGRNGGYGKYIRVRHNSTYHTAYAHLSRFAKGLGRGRRVRQGQVIGYVGSTGSSTGPHLHYEILRHHKQINPLTLKMPAGDKLTGKALAAFDTHRAGIDRQVAILAAGDQRLAADGDRPPAPQSPRNP